MANLTDAQVVALCRNGDDVAWAALVDRFERYVYSICARGFSLPQHAAEDVFQDVFARAFQHLDCLRDDEAIKPWLAQTTRRLCIDYLRRDSREEPVEDLPEAATGDAWLGELEEALMVRQAMAGVSQACQEILDRFFARDQSYATIARELDLAPGTIASRISRCLTKLRAALESPSGSQAAEVV